MRLHKLPVMLVGYQWIAVQGLFLEEPLNLEKGLEELQAISLKRKVSIQIVEANCLCGARHAFHAGNLALKAHQEKRGRAKRIEMEVMLYLAGVRQIGEAINLVGARNRAREVGVLAFGGSENIAREALHEVAKPLQGRVDDYILEVTLQKRESLQELHDISDEELALVTGGGDWREGLLKLVMERAAMVDALKK